MGTWGTDHFDNDTACDFAHDIAESDDLGLVEAAIEDVLDFGDESLEAPTAEEALVAGEVLARLRGRFGARNAYTEDIDRWVKEHPLSPAPALLADAVAAIDRILTPPSELLELWEDSDDAAEWKSRVADLRGRLAP